MPLNRKTEASLLCEELYRVDCFGYQSKAGLLKLRRGAKDLFEIT
jgi:hypothetical protein